MSDATIRCERCESVLAPDDLRCAICNLAAPAVENGIRKSTRITILRCSGCGAAMTYEVAKRAAACAFCGSVLEAEQPRDPIEAAELLLPFTVDRSQADRSFRQWLGGLGWFRPGDLKTDVRLESIRPLHWVAWVFDAQVDVTWAADTDAGALRAEWAPHSGAARLTFDDVVVPATRGLSREEVTQLTSSYDLDTAKPISSDDAGTVERFDIPRSAARARLVGEIERLARNRLTERHLPGSRVRNLHTATILEGLATRRIGFPAWVLAYRYRSKLYRTVLSGQDAACLKGSAPISIARIVGVAAAAAAAVLAVLLLLAAV